MSSRNKIASFGPYTGMSYEEIVAADPWYIVDLHNAGGNHGISDSLYNRAVRLMEEYSEDEYEETDDLILAQALAFGLPQQDDY